MDKIVEVTNISKQFGTFEAVNNLSFTVNKGDVYGFLGQNGAGKSTTIRMLLTLITPSSGAIEIFGKQLNKHRIEILKQVGAVIERPDMYKYLSALSNLNLFAKMSGLMPTKNMLMEQLEKVGLADRALDKIGTYSQGMKQRLGIAIALVHNPQLIILDEPTNGLDPQGIADMRNLIINLRTEHKKTVIVSSHLLSEIEQIATRMIIIHKGKKVVEGNTNELFNPADTLVVLQSNTPNISEILRTTKWNNLLTKTIEGWQFKLHENEVSSLAKDLVFHNISIDNLSKKHSLENLFLQLTSNIAANTK